jgi:hypothetical protein
LWNRRLIACLALRLMGGIGAGAAVPAACGGGCRRVGLGASAQAVQLRGVALLQAPRAVTLVLAAELVAQRGMVARCGSVAHCRQLRAGEQLELPHAFIISRPGPRR